MSKVVKVCACGREHTESQWPKLESVGTMDGYPADGDEPAIPPIELKNCPCGSTLALEVSDAA